MGSLLRKLSALLEAPVVHHPGGNYRLPTGVKNRVRLLKEDLEEIKMYLEELSEVVDPPRTAKSWMREVRELSYDIEDYVDSCCCLRPCLTYGNIKSTRFACKISHFKISRRRKKKSKMHRKVAGDISGFRICAQEAIEWHERYELDCPTFRRRFAPCGPMLLAPYEQGAEVVIDGRMNEFIDSVANDGDKQLKVVSVVGPGSLGKTTLVQVLYNRLKGQFQYRAFVRLTRKPDIKAVLHDILAQVLRHQSLDDSEHLDLTVKIRKHLQDKCLPSIGKFKLLRVMSLQLSDHNDKDTFDLTGIYELFHLRYLKIAGDVCIQLPEQMRGLKYLETLDISAKVTAIPWDIIHLPCLLHLHLPLDQNMLAWIGNMRFDNEWSLGKLTSNLWNLRVTCDTQPREHLERNMEALGSVLGGFSKLKTLALVPGPSQGKTLIRFPSEVLLAWDGFTSPVLQRFEWSLNSCLFFSVPKWTAKLGSLRVLKIVVQELLTDSIDILKRLPVLTDLSLYWKAANHEMIVFDKVGFSSLEYFKIRCTVPWLKFEANAMPKLRKLKLGFNAHRAGLHVSIPIRIDHLPGLKDISAKIGGARVNEETALKAFISNHPRILESTCNWLTGSFTTLKVQVSVPTMESVEPW
ncbi:hypothetical protein PR202_ga28428 [Eleusine coracana subsp. coracana]|uniref:Uncharacterized protein n=1 Tax=Eleusine coracana subsp. coracana TaxID=191504 RepID=A0AAV5DJL0_ELECO|nr:hypothetical protein PR202_ga28428 [Eleusine coracana subsp. coracana]